jgi:coniferyl-aldehyde dehydrogenase
MNSAQIDIGSPMSDTASIVDLQDVFAAQRAAFLRDGIPTPEVRIDRIDRAIAVLIDHRQAICDAISDDFSSRAYEQTLLLDVYAAIEQLKYNRKHLRRWMKPERRGANFPLNLLGASAEIRYQPKGVVANIGPWNFPVLAAFGPLAPMLAAGNRVIIKVSELTPRTAELCRGMIASAFDATEVAAVCGGPDLGTALTALPFDHIFFTGSPRVGQLVLKSAASNMTPVTLELGGKSPVIIADDADLALAAYRIAWAKLLNSGQICVTADYALISESRLRPFIAEYEHAVARLYPTLRDNPDYTAMISEHHRRRVFSYVEDARSRGAEIIEINAAHEDFTHSTSRKLAPTLVINPGDDCRLMQEEIFGPVLPVKTYRDLGDALSYINARPRPLALYVFGGKRQADRVLSSTISGGAAVNDIAMQVLQENLPFGGSGSSGMGNYHAEFGFRTFSHARAVYRGIHADPLAVLRPPFTKRTRRVLEFLTGGSGTGGR